MRDFARFPKIQMEGRAGMVVQSRLLIFQWASMRAAMLTSRSLVGAYGNTRWERRRGFTPRFCSTRIIELLNLFILLLLKLLKY